MRRFLKINSSPYGGMADTTVSRTVAERRGGSNPSTGTKIFSFAAFSTSGFWRNPQGKERRMAGIKEAMKRVMDKRHRGVVVAQGRLKECSCKENEGCSDCSKTEYVIIELLHDGGRITQYDYGSDLRISKKIKVGDSVILNIKSNYCAEWEIDKGRMQYRDMTSAQELICNILNDKGRVEVVGSFPKPHFFKSSNIPGHVFGSIGKLVKLEGKSGFSIIIHKNFFTDEFGVTNLISKMFRDNIVIHDIKEG